MVERNLAKVEVDGSNPFTRSNPENPVAQAAGFFCFRAGCDSIIDTNETNSGRSAGAAWEGARTP